MPQIKLSEDELQKVLQALYVAASTNQTTYGATRHMFLARIHEAGDRKGEVRCRNPRCVDAACEAHFHTRIDIPYPNEKRVK